jgi:hypothetical protein
MADPSIAAYLARGYTREQAFHQVANEQRKSRPPIPPTSQRYDEEEIAVLIGRGFPREVAVQMVQRKFDVVSRYILLDGAVSFNTYHLVSYSSL